MNKPQATFILSFDCEGRWGRENFGLDIVPVTNDAMISVYSRLVRVLRDFSISATFAFVGALLLSREEVDEQSDLFNPLPWRGGDWYALFLRDRARGSIDGWLCPELLDIVRCEERGHEIASHGFSHCILAPAVISAADFDREMRQLRIVETLRGLHTQTFVFPCNKVGYLDRLAEAGFAAYRLPSFIETRTGQHWRLMRLVDEFNYWESPSGPGCIGAPSALPSGRYINCRVGIRKLVPMAITLGKISRMLDASIAHGGVVHLYSHPEEFILAPEHFNLLEAILALVAARVRAGRMSAFTQLDYLRHHLTSTTASQIGSKTSSL